MNEEESKIYDEVDERDYEILVKRKLKEEDFVVDDDGNFNYRNLFVSTK